MFQLLSGNSSDAATTATYSSSNKNQNSSETVLHIDPKPLPVDHQQSVMMSSPVKERQNGGPRQISSGHQNAPTSFFLRLSSMIFYGLASFFITVVNKQVLTGHKFPSFQVLGIGQMVSTIVVLYVARMAGWVKFPHFSREIIPKIWPLPMFYLGNMLFGLGGTKELSLPMMTVLRRFSILMTMIAEYYVLRTRPETSVQMSVYLMIFGAMVAAIYDLGFNLKGYIFLLLNDVCTAGNGVYAKKKLEARDLGKYGLMFYNSLFMLFPTVIFALQSGDLERAAEFDGWSNASFLFEFSLSCVFGFILSAATMVCTQYNSALTTTIVGCLKNVVITYLGMIIGGDYIFSWPNFIGLNISIIGSLIYTKVTLSSKPKATNSSSVNAPSSSQTKTKSNGFSSSSKYANVEVKYPPGSK